jgi:hypothetical protein
LLTQIIAQSNIFSSGFSEGAGMIHNLGLIMRILLGIWLYSLDVIRVLFSSGLEVAFSTHILPEQLDTIEDLMDDDYKIYIPIGTSIMQKLQDSSNQRDKRLVTKATHDGTLVPRLDILRLEMLEQVIREKVGLLLFLVVSLHVNADHIPIPHLSMSLGMLSSPHN